MHRRYAGISGLPDVSTVCWSCKLKQQRHSRYINTNVRSYPSTNYDAAPSVARKVTPSPIRRISLPQSTPIPLEAALRSPPQTPPTRKERRTAFVQRATFRKIGCERFISPETGEAVPPQEDNVGRRSSKAVPSSGSVEGAQLQPRLYGAHKTSIRTLPVNSSVLPLSYHFSQKKALDVSERSPANIIHKQVATSNVDDKFDSILEGFQRLVSMQSTSSQTSEPAQSESSSHKPAGAGFKQGDGSHLASNGVRGTSRAARAPPGERSPPTTRQYHSSAKVYQQAIARRVEAPFNTFHPMPPPSLPVQQPHKPDIRERLREWQEINGRTNVNLDVTAQIAQTSSAEISELARIGDVDDFREQENERDVDDLAGMKEAEEPEDGNTNLNLLRPGDLVELPYLSSDREPVLAVYVRRIEQQLQCYTMHGKWVHRRMQAVHFSIPKFMNPSMLDDLLPHLPSEPVTDEMLDKAQIMDLSVPREVGAKVVNKIVSFWRAAETVYRNNASVLDSAHAALAHPTDLRFGSLERIAMQLLRKKELSEVDYYAVRRALVRGGWGFGYDARDHSRTNIFQIRSKDVTEKIESVREWLREYQEELALRANDSNVDAADSEPRKKLQGAEILEAFLEKSRLLIAESRRSRYPTVPGAGCVGPSLVRIPITKTTKATRIIHSFQFSKTDQAIIRFLELWCVSSSFRHQPRLWGLGPLVLRAVGLYPNEGLGLSTAFVFLQEIGVIVPHENRVAHDEHLLLPTSQHSKPLERLSSMVQVEAANPNTKYTDAMQELRHDWKDLAVYCVDSASAAEIDDGFSLERIPGSLSEYWVHIHIANPTAFLERGDSATKLAAHMTETVYFPERVYPMLPRDMTRKHLGLAKDRPALTFSARINSQGHVLEVKARSGFIRNVISLTPDELSRSLGLGSTASTDVEVIVGGKLPGYMTRKQYAPRLSPQQKDDLLTLHHLAGARSKLRQEAGGLFLEMNHPDVSVIESFNFAGLGWSHPSRNVARHIEGDPIICMRSQTYRGWFGTAESGINMVKEFMLMCCEIGALWCRQRNIPILYRGTVEAPETMAADVYKREILDPSKDENGIPPLEVSRGYINTIGMVLLTTTPTAHRFVGVPQYSKVTSPLRRYGDMITHWQIEAALREEASSGTSLVGSDRADYLPFSKAEIDLVIHRLQSRERLITSVKRTARMHWIAQLFLRAHHYGEAALPETLQVLVYNVHGVTGDVFAFSTEYSTEMKLLNPKPHGLGEAMIGDIWEARIHHVNAYDRWVKLTPTRLVKREAYQEARASSGQRVR